MTALLLRNLYNPVSIQVRRHRAQIKSKRRTKSMLGPTIRIGVEGSYADTVLRSSLPDSSNLVSIMVNHPFSLERHTEQSRLDSQSELNPTTLSHWWLSMQLFAISERRRSGRDGE